MAFFIWLCAFVGTYLIDRSENYNALQSWVESTYGIQMTNSQTSLLFSGDDYDYVTVEYNGEKIDLFAAKEYNEQGNLKSIALEYRNGTQPLIPLR